MKTVLSPSRHGVLVDDGVGGHGDGARRQWRRRGCRGWRCRRAGSARVDLRDDVLQWQRTRWQAGRPAAESGWDVALGGGRRSRGRAWRG
jgi:hypothetical protein